MGVLPRVVTTVPRVRTSSVSASAGSSNPESEAESSPESDQRQIIAVHQPINRIRRINLPLPDHDGTSTVGRCKYGKRKQRRFMNRDYLLQKVDEEDDEDFAFNVMEFRKSPFQRLYETMSAVAALATMDALDGLASYEAPTATLAKPRHPYMRISRKIRHSIQECVRKRSKAKMVVQVVRDTEEELLSLRSASKSAGPTTVELLWKSYIHRLLVHAVAQYHGLRSATVLTDEMGNVPPVVRVVITPYSPEKDQQASLLHDLIRFVYTDALADALAAALPNQEIFVNTEV